MSKKGLLKAEFNRVRTSTALKANDMWTNTIGLEQDPQAGSNAVIEASIYAPSKGGGHRGARQERAQQLIEASGYQPSVTDYQGLLSLAKAQGIGRETRGACKLCGGLGHLTKKCTNFITGHNAAAGVEVNAAAAATVGAAPGAPTVLGLLPDLPDIPDISASDVSTSSGSSGSGSDSSSSDSDSSREKKRSRKQKKSKDNGKKHKKHSSKDKVKKRKHKSKDRKSRKDKKARTSSLSPRR